MGSLSDCILAILATILVYPSIVKSSCDKSVFRTSPDQSGTGTVLDLVGPTTARACVRACRMDVCCYSFNMETVGPDRGVCHLLDGVSKAGMVDYPGWTFYWTCPPGMAFYGPSDSCYSLIQTKMTWWEARTACSGIHPEAHLVDILNSVEQDEALEVFRQRNVSTWTAGQRVTGYFTWSTTGQPLTYTAWAAGRPRDKDCITISRINGGKWIDIPCDKTKFVICEFSNV